jgi:hypothetical protein
VQPFACTTRLVRAIASAFTSSIVASAVRLVERSDEACAVVYTERGHIVWAKRSRMFVARIPDGMKIGPGAVAFDYFNRNMLDTAPREVPAIVWLGSATRGSMGPTMIEHAEVVPEPGWGGVMSILWVPFTTLATTDQR